MRLSIVGRGFCRSSDDVIETTLAEYIADEEGLTEEEIDSLSNLEVGQEYEMGVHFGYVTFTRIE
jgi:uncharacterized protein YdgA (DUF945 family)